MGAAASRTARPTGSFGGGGGVESTRFKSVVQRLMRISFAVTFMWLLALSLDVATWAVFFRQEVPPLSLPVARIVILQSIGFADAVILGNLFQVRLG